MKKIVFLAVSATAVASMTFGGTAAAATAANSDPIGSGLRAGANLQLGSAPYIDDGLNSSDSSEQTKDAQKPLYVALGDSVSAGYGLPSAKNPTNTAVRCSRSPQSYPNIVAKNTNMRLRNISCAGATVGDLFTRQSVSGPNIKPQLDSAFSQGTPALMSITAGANDAHWADFIRACYAVNCNSQAYTTVANAYLVSMQVKLHTALSSIYLRSGGSPPRVIMTGYYNPLSAACVQQQTNITPAEIKWLSDETTALNTTLQNVIRHYSFVTYAPVDFTGHDICSKDSWIQGPTAAGAFHPTAAGQKTIAKAVQTAIGK